MIHIDKSIIIRRPVEEVFTYVSDLTHSAKWQIGLLEVRKTTPGPLGIGTKYTLVRVFMGRRMEASNEFVEFVPNVKVAFKSTSGPIPFKASYQFEPSSGDVKLTSTIEMHPKGFFNLAEPLISASLQKDVEVSLGKLKDMLESQIVPA